MNSDSAEKEKPWALSFRRTLNHSLQWALSIFLFLQCSFIGVILFYGDIRVPGFLIQWINQELETYNITAEYDSIEIDLGGRILLRDIEVTHKDYPTPLLKAKRILADIVIWELFFKNIKLEQLIIGSGEVHCPALYSPTGKDEALIHHLHLNASRTGKRWEIDYFQFKSAELFAHINGVFMPRELIDETKPHSADLPPEKLSAPIAFDERLRQYLAYGESFLQQRRYLEQFNAPHIAGTLVPLENGDTSLQLKIYAQDYITPEGLHLESMMGTTELLWTAEGLSLQPESTHLNIGQTRWQENISLGKITAYPSAKESIRLEADIPEITFHAHNAQGYGLTLNANYGSIAVKNWPALNASIFIQSADAYLQLTAEGDYAEQSALLQLHSNWNPKALFNSTLLETSEVSKRFKIPDTPELDVILKFLPGFQFDSADFQAQFDRITYRELSLSSLYARGRYHKGKIDIHEAILKSPTYTVQGTYQQDLATNDYRFLLEGNINPRDLDSIIKEEWWLDLWPMFEYHSSILPYSEIDIQGRYFGGAAHRSIFAFNHLQSVSFRDVELVDLQSMLWGEPTHIMLYDLKGVDPQGRYTDLGLSFNYKPGVRGRYSLAFDGYSNLPLDQAAKMCGPETQEITDSFTLSSNPEVIAKGLIFDRASGRGGERYLNIKAQIDAPCIYSGAHFDRAQFRAILTPQDLSLENVSLGFAGGNATGSAYLERSADQQDTLNFDIRLENAHYLKIPQQLPFVFEDVAEKTKYQNTKTGVGLLDLNLAAEGIYGEPWSFVGQGDARIKEADLGKLHLFGGLSRALLAANIKFGALSLTEAYSPIVLDQGSIHFNDLEVKGPSALIQAQGNIQLPEQDLDFRVIVSPFSEMETPVVSQIMNLLNPIAWSIETKLKGTFQEPKYGMNFRPFKVLTEKMLGSEPTESTSEELQVTDP